MNIVMRKRSFEDFFEHKTKLIAKYEKGYISKKGFLIENYNYFISSNANPFINVNTYDKGIYNYQYFNVLAKYYKMLANKIKYDKKNNRQYNHYLNLSIKYYKDKDDSILDILKNQKFQNIDSYFIKCDSNSLKNVLYEIVLKDKKEAIFHSKAKWLLEILIKNDVFINQERDSIISEYINEKY